MKSFTAAVVVNFLLILIFPIYSQATGDCTKAGCHDKIGQKQFIHGPVGAGICNVCHVPVEGEDHKFQFFAEKSELCFACHETSRDIMLEEYLHTPVAEGNCVGCHDPHASDYRFNLKGKADSLCFQCHDSKPFSLPEVHGPVAVGDCNSCHNPHASANEKQLLVSLPQLCLDCHKEKTEEMNKRHIHSPVKESCIKCHSPHSSVNKFMLPEKTPDLCFTCHPDIFEFTSLDFKHQPVEQGTCGDCHDVHSSDNPRLFPVAPDELCLTCHAEIKELVTTSTYKHGPVKDGDCNACHNPHGSEYAKILKKYFPEEFYIPYAEDNYDLCFECHNRNVATDENTTKLTQFRDKDENLHFLHVNKQKKGRSCRACHQVHASSQEKHIRNSVPYGKIGWDLPVNYAKNEDGGKCVVGCHGPKEYKR